MRAITIILALAAVLSSGCDQAVDHDAGGETSGETSGTSGESTGEAPEATEGSEEGSTGEVDVWEGEALLVRYLELEGGSCDITCGASECIGSTQLGVPRPCDDRSGSTCICADDALGLGIEPTHAVSDCYLAPNAPDPEGWEASVMPRWGGGSCDDFCADEGLGECSWIHWGGRVDFCPDPLDAIVFDLERGSVSAPDAPGQVFRFACEM